MAEFDPSSFIKGAGEGAARMRETALKAVDVFGEVVIGHAQQITPVKTGFLNGSATTEPATEEGGKVGKVIGFNAEYAAAVHERVDAKHQVGQSKYLEAALREDSPKMSAFVAGRCKEAMG